MQTTITIKRDGKEHPLTYAELLAAHQAFENRMVIDKLVEALAARMCDEDDEKAIKNDIDKYLDQNDISYADSILYRVEVVAV